MKEIACAVCGKMIDADDAAYLDNGSPACPECVQYAEENKND